MTIRAALLVFPIAAAASPAAEIFRADFARYPASWLSSPVGVLNARRVPGVEPASPSDP
jgi:hypothetical protein